MAKIKIDSMEFEWDGNNLLEFEQVKECLEIFKTMGLEIERIKAANKRIAEEHKIQLKKMYPIKK